MGEIVFQMVGDFIFKLGGGGAPWGASVLIGGKCWTGGVLPHAPTLLQETLKPFIKKGLLEEME